MIVGPNSVNGQSPPAYANDNADPDVPLRLDKAIEVCFPFGGMTVSGLRREAKAGRLMVEKIANKLFTTPRAIAEMRKLCRVEAGGPDFGGEKTAGGTAGLSPRARGLSSMESNSTPRAALLAKIERHRNV
jgi:hypothetical protein